MVRSVIPEINPFFRFADSDESRRTLTAAGFVTPVTSTIPLTWYGNTPQDVLDIIYKSTVRTALMLDAQTAEARQQIHQAILRGVEQYHIGERFEIAIPALMATAFKP